MTHDVFISFSFADQKVAEDIVNTLTSKYGISCWICTRDLDGGDYYKALIPDAIDAAKVIVFIQSSHAVESKEVPKEIGIAFDADKIIIPFRVDDAKLTGKLRYDLYGVEYIDATIPTLEERIFDLATSISKAINKPLTNNITTEDQKPVLASSKIVYSEIFAGRDDLIEDIHAAFNDRNVVFLHGMGGIGKSELARQYWKKYKELYPTVVFARYDNSLAALISDDTVFAVDGTARKTKKGDVPQTDEEYARDKLAVLRQNTDEHTLLIIDNFDVTIKDDPFFEEAISGLNCRILVTTRCEPDKKKYHVIPVGEMDDSALKELFIQYANPQKTIVEKDDPDFDELFRLTNRHTYTLELVAKFMEENDDIDYISEMIGFLKERGFGEIKVNGYDNICKLFRFTSLDENEKYFLRCLAMMPASGISQKLFKKWIDSAFSSRSRLVDLSLVKINGETRTISLHPVVREVVINELKPSYENCKAFIDRCAMVGEDAIPIMWNLPYEEKAMLFECYKSILSIVTEINENTYPLYTNISYMYNYIGSYTQAIELHERIYGFVKETYGKESAEAMLVFNRIAWKNANCELYEEAMKYYTAAADWFYNQKSCYTKTREVHDHIRGCADIYYYMYRQTQNPSYRDATFEYLKKSEKYGQRMLEETANASETYIAYLKYQINGTCRNYFKIYIDDNDFGKAEECLRTYYQAIQEFSKFSSAPDADIAGYYRHLSQLQYAKGDYQEALDNFRESYRLYQAYFSSKNPRIIQILEELTKCYIKLGDYENAQKYISMAIENAAAIYTNDHPRLTGLRECEREISSVSLKKD